MCQPICRGYTKYFTDNLVFISSELLGLPSLAFTNLLLIV